jgi:hypothetical protein
MFFFAFGLLKVFVYLIFVNLGKKIGWAPPVSSSSPAATMIFLVYFFNPNNSFLDHNLRQRLLVLFF